MSRIIVSPQYVCRTGNSSSAQQDNVDDTARLVEFIRAKPGMRVRVNTAKPESGLAHRFKQFVSSKHESENRRLSQPSGFYVKSR